MPPVILYLAQGGSIKVPPNADIITTFLGYGIAGVLFLMIIFKWKIQPTYVADDKEEDWRREKEQLISFQKAEIEQLVSTHEATIKRITENRERERSRLEAEIVELKGSVNRAAAVYEKDVIPMMTTIGSRMGEWIDVLNKLRDQQRGVPDGR